MSIPDVQWRLRHAPTHGFRLFVTVLFLGACRDAPEQHGGKPMSYWITQITSTDSSQRRAAAEAFAHDAARSPEAARALLAVLQTERTSDVHAVVAEALGSLGTEGATAVPELVRLSRDEHAEVRRHAASALANIGASSTSAVETLTAALDDADHDVRAAPPSRRSY